MSNDKFSIGIIGGGNASLELMERLLAADFIDLVGVADLDSQAPGMILARDNGITTMADFKDFFKKDKNLDIIIDVTGVKAVRDGLREYMQVSNNHHTVIMHERISGLLVSLFKNKMVMMKDEDEEY